MNTNYLAHLASETSLALVLQQAGLSTNQNILLCLVDMWLDKVLYHLNILIFSAFFQLFTNLLLTTIGMYICSHVMYIYFFLINLLFWLFPLMTCVGNNCLLPLSVLDLDVIEWFRVTCFILLLKSCFLAFHHPGCSILIGWLFMELWLCLLWFSAWPSDSALLKRGLSIWCYALNLCKVCMLLCAFWYSTCRWTIVQIYREKPMLWHWLSFWPWDYLKLWISLMIS